MKLSLLATRSIGSLYGEDRTFESLSTDTRTLQKGQLFVALRGDNYDAHEKIEEAQAGGACAVVIDKPVNTRLPYLLVDDTCVALGKIGALYRENFKGCVIGLTGSCGKTSVKGMLKSIFDVKNMTSATEGNLNNHIGVPLTLTRLKPNAEFAIVEAGTSGKGEIAYLTDLIKPNIAMVINVHAAHLAGFGGLASIAKEKSAIYGVPGLDAAIINLDDENCDILYAAAKNDHDTTVKPRRLVGFSQGKARSVAYQVDDLVTGNGIEFDALGCPFFKLQINNQAQAVALNVLGEHAIENALAAAAAAHAAGVAVDQIKQGLEAFKGVRGRMEIVKGLNECVLINDSYNANPGSMRAAIDFLSRHDDSYLICGDMGELGDEERHLHAELGRYAQRKAIRWILSVGDVAKYISAEAGAAGVHFSSKEELIEAGKALFTKDSVVLVKGSRSMKMETIVHALTASGGH